MPATLRLASGLLLLALALFPLAGCGGSGSGGGGGSAAGNKTIRVYSPHGKFLPELKQRFETAHPGYTVLFQDMGGGKIFEKVKAEKARPGADVWYGGAPADFTRAETLGLLDPYLPEGLKSALPAEAKSPTGGWIATFRTPEVIVYNHLKVPAGEVPANWDELIDPKWKGRIAIRDVRDSAGMKTIFAALIVHEHRRTGDPEAGFRYLQALDANTGTYAAEPSVLYELLKADGPYALSVWNLPDVQGLINDPKKPYPFAYLFPKPAPVLVEPIAILKGCANPAGARLFHDFANSPEVLLWLAQERFRIPVRTDLPAEKLPQWMSQIKLEPMPMDWQAMSLKMDAWIDRWQSEIRGKNR